VPQDQDKGERATQATVLVQAEEIQEHIHRLAERDLQLWSIGLLIILVLTAGMSAIVFPNVAWAQPIVRLEPTYMPQLFYGLISLIVLSNIYFLTQKLRLNNTSRSLINQLVLNERMENLSLVDPLTHLLNRRALDEMLPKEIARANRSGSPLTFMNIDINSFRRINAEFGTAEGDQLLRDFAAMLTQTFRGGDMVFRHGGDEFLVVMADTREEDTIPPIHRLLQAIDRWNADSGKAYELSASWGTASYFLGTDVADLLRAIDRKVYQKKHNLATVF
jgi:diguanylate cyclase (GGDEF)-like protein